MKISNDNLTFTVPITLSAHRIAQKFYQQQSNAKKGKQIYLNTLAVYAVNCYLECLGVKTDLEGSDSWNPYLQILADSADLIIKERGRLECRPVLPGDQVCQIPEEALSERIGCVPVRLDQSLTEAQLLGFVPEVVHSEFPLERLQSLEDLLGNISTFPEVVQLSQWRQNLFESSWKKISELLEPLPSELAWSPIRGKHVLKRGKLLDLGTDGIDERVALLVGLKPTNLPEVDLSVEVYPTGYTINLPRELQLMVLDGQGEAVMQATAKNTKNIQLEFSGEVGESFSVKVALGEACITEDFVI